MIRILIIILLLISSHASALAIEWIPLGTAEKNGDPLTINGNDILEYKNAGRGGIDWEVSGDGPRGGLGLRELWLFDNSRAGIPDTSQAITTFSVISNSIGFVMDGDHNDGLAQFFVDDLDMGIYDMYRTGNRILVVTGLDSIAHTLRVVQLGLHNAHSAKGDVAIYGGAAFNTLAAAIPEPAAYAMLLTGLGLLSFVTRYRKQSI